MTQSRRWCFTHNLRETENYELFVKALRAFKGFRAVACQLECAPTTGRRHIQGYAEFNKPVRMGALKKICLTTHWEIAKGSRKQCVDYCTKDDTACGEEEPFFRVCDELLTEDTSQGKRNDLLECAKLISSGEWDKETVHEERPDLILKFSKGVNELLRFREQAQTTAIRPLLVEVIYGPAGTGKTRHAFGNGSDVYLLENSNGNAVWWDGYNGESTLVIDDFYGWIPHNQLLRFLDIYPLRLDIKGGTTYAKWTHVYLTSNVHPSKWYKKFQWDDDGALQRRIHHIWFAPMSKEWKDEKSDKVLKIDFN